MWRSMNDEPQLKCDETVRRNVYLQTLLENNVGQQPISTKRGLSKGEGLTKIWMCPSTEVIKGIVRDPYELSKNVSQRIFNTKKYLEGLGSQEEGETEGIESSTALRKSKKESTVEESEESDSDLISYLPSGYEEGEIEASEEEEEEEILNEKLVIMADDEKELFSEEQSVEEIAGKKMKRAELENKMKQAILRGEKRKFRQKLVNAYNMSFDEISETIKSHAISNLEEQLIDSALDIQAQAEAAIKEDMNEIKIFFEAYHRETLEECFTKYCIEYSNKRDACIMNAIHCFEDKLKSAVTNAEKEVNNYYEKKIYYLQNIYFEEYTKKLRDNAKFWSSKVREIKGDLETERVMNIKMLEFKYLIAFTGLRGLEEKEYKESLTKIEKLQQEIKEKVERQERERATFMSIKKQKFNREEDVWKCIAVGLMKQIQNFIKKHVPSRDVKDFSSLFKIMNEVYGKENVIKIDSSSVQNEKELLPSGEVDSVDSIICGKNIRVRTKEENRLHKELIKIAADLILEIIDSFTDKRVTLSSVRRQERISHTE